VDTRLDTATYISGAGHLGLIAWIMFGGIFAPEPLPFEVTQVSVISGAEFDALQAAQQAPQSTTVVALPETPEAGSETPDATSAPDESTKQTAPEPSEIPPPDVVPEVPALPEIEPAESAPEQPVPPEDIAVLAPEIQQEAVPNPAERVAPEPVAEPDPEAAPAEVEQEAVTEAETGETTQEPQLAQAPEEATTEIVTEATAAPARSIRPPANRPSAPAPTPAAQPEQAEQSETPTQNTDSAVNAALAEALGGGEEPAVPSGPPMSAGERDSLRVAVSNCWNVGALSSEALQTTVVVAVRLAEDGKPLAGSVKLLSSSGGSDAAAGQAFGAARRAILRCGARGYDLPSDKYDQWREIEMTFNPEGMRLK
jgi:hypothetical protein